jgi:hypothetical protein
MDRLFIEIEGASQARGAFCLHLLDTKTNQTQTLVSLAGGAWELAQWLKRNREPLLNGRAPVEEGEFSSIAETIANFYENLDPDDNTNDMVQRVYDYRGSHSLRFALRGADVDDIYLGVFRDKHQISLWTDKVRWQFTIGLRQFLDEVERLKPA